MRGLVFKIVDIIERDDKTFVTFFVEKAMVRYAKPIGGMLEIEITPPFTAENVANQIKASVTGRQGNLSVDNSNADEFSVLVESILNSDS